MTEEQVRRGPKDGPRLKTLLTQTLPYGATMNDLVTAGFRGELKPYLDDHKVEVDADGRYRWVGKADESLPEPARKVEAATEYPPVTKFQFHELCHEPLIVGDEFEAFCADIKERGQLEHITLHPDGTVSRRSQQSAGLPQARHRREGHNVHG
jgi:hypothetical protein